VGIPTYSFIVAYREGTMQEITMPFNGNTFLIKIGQGEKINQYLRPLD